MIILFDVVILMAGSGTRSKLEINKVFYEIDNLPIYQYSLNTFRNIKECDRIILVIRREDEIMFNELDKKVIYTYGGFTRQDSVYNGVSKAENDIVLIHDGARCNIKEKDILNLYESALSNDASLLVNKVTNAIKVVNGNKVIDSLNRNILYEAQTPQAVNKKMYQEAYKLAKIDNYEGFDDVEIMQKYLNITPVIVEGKRSNIKVTTPIDLEIMKILLKEDI